MFNIAAVDLLSMHHRGIKYKGQWVAMHFGLRFQSQILLKRGS